MTNDHHNPDDIAYLASQSLDGPLSADDAERLRAHQDSSPEAERWIGDFRRVEALVKQWGSQSPDVDVDAEAFVEGVLGRIADAHAAEESSKLDEVLREWREPVVEVDPTEFLEAVHRRLPERRAHPDQRFHLYRLGRSLAVAAAVALSVSAVFWFQRSRRPTVEVSIQSLVEYQRDGAAEAAPTSRVVIFDRTVVADATGSRFERRASFSTISEDRFAADAEEIPPF